MPSEQKKKTFNCIAEGMHSYLKKSNNLTVTENKYYVSCLNFVEAKTIASIPPAL